MKDSTKSVTLEVDLSSASDKVPVYSNQLSVNSDGDAFMLAFFEISPPLLVGTPEEQLKKLETSGGVIKGNCVARVAVPVGRMEVFIKALIENYERHQEQHQGEMTQND